MLIKVKDLALYFDVWSHWRISKGYKITFNYKKVNLTLLQILNFLSIKFDEVVTNHSNQIVDIKISLLKVKARK